MFKHDQLANTKTIKKTMLLGAVAISSTVTMNANAINEYQASFVADAQTNQVAFVPFSGSPLISSVVMNDLNSTELQVTSRNLPQQAHSSAELNNTLRMWQQTRIPYLVVGSTRSSNGKIIINYEVIDVNSGRVLQGKQSYVSGANPQKLRSSSHVIADKIYEIITGNEGDFSGRIAYIEEKGTGANKTSSLKIMDADGQNAQSIFSVEGSIFSPAWSPDGRNIAFSVQRPKGLPVIYVQNVDSQNSPMLVTPFLGGNLSPSFSPDGASIIFSSSYQGTNADIWQIQLGSNQPQKLISMPSDEVQPSYAPDGRSFLFVSNKTGVKTPQIYRYQFGTGQISRVTKGGYATTPSYNQDATKIAFLNGGNAAIMNVSGGGVQNLAYTGIDEAPSFSPNGNRVVYASKNGSQGIIHIQSLNGGEHLRKAARGIVRSPVWSKRPK